jgi:hypothetical protein
MLFGTTIIGAPAVIKCLRSISGAARCVGDVNRYIYLCGNKVDRGLQEAMWKEQHGGTETAFKHEPLNIKVFVEGREVDLARNC